MVKVKLFASLKDLAGASEVEVELESETPVEAVLEQLEARFPGFQKYRPVVLVAINQEYAGLQSLVSPGDELAFFPPVSGGVS